MVMNADLSAVALANGASGTSDMAGKRREGSGRAQRELPRYKADRFLRGCAFSTRASHHPPRPLAADLFLQAAVKTAKQLDPINRPLRSCATFCLEPGPNILQNGANGMSDMEGKAARVAASERGQRASFKIAKEAKS